MVTIGAVIFVSLLFSPSIFDLPFYLTTVIVFSFHFQSAVI